MLQTITYGISDIEPYINWLYFYHAWGLSGKPQSEKDRMRREAEEKLHAWDGHYHCHARFGIFDANSDGDDLLIDGVRLPMLRQQKPTQPGEPNLCLADFVRPKDGGVVDQVGVFCTSVDVALVDDHATDDYQRMLAQVLSDRLAEGTAERMHEEVRRHYWGYAPDEQLTMEQTHLEEYQGIRPAVGYPSMPDASMNFILDQLLDMKKIGIRLTQSGMMTPHASVSGLMLAHPKSHYFDLGKIGEDQLKDYARRRGLPVELMRKWLRVAEKADQ